jgi:integrase
MTAYHVGLAAAKDAPRAAPAPAEGTLDALAASYYASTEFAALRASTQAAYRRIVEELRAKHGSKPIRLLNPEAVRHLMGEKVRTAANHRLRLLRLLMAHAVEAKMLTSDPTVGVRRVKHRAAGYATWTEEEIAAYEARHPIGSRARLAMALLLYTGQRRSDVVRMGRQHLRGGMIEVRQVKTGAELLLPVHPALAGELAHVPPGQMVFLHTEQRGRSAPFTAAGFYNTFRRWCEEAGIPAGRSPHGLRKACARRLAEAGATVHQIAAVTGHRTLAEVERYTRAVEQAGLARAAMRKIENGTSNPNPLKLPTRQKIGG